MALGARLRGLDAVAAARLRRWREGPRENSTRPRGWLALFFFRTRLPEPILGERMWEPLFQTVALGAIAAAVGAVVALWQAEVFWGFGLLGVSLGAAWLAYTTVTSPLDTYPDKTPEEDP